MSREVNEGFRSTGRSIVDDGPGYGMYVWENPDGEIFGDDEGNVMNVFCMKGDREAIKVLAQAAKYYGAGEGKPVWWPGKRRIDDEELEYQQMRERMGLEPDPLNYGAIKEERLRRQTYDK